MNKFATSVEASKIIDDLRVQARQLNYNSDIQKLIRNAERQLAELSAAEVRARQQRRTGASQSKIEALAQSIDYIEKMLLILRLIQ